MSKKDDALKLALAAERVLKAWDDPQGMPALCEEMNCLREALAEQPAQQEPVAWIRWEWNRTGRKSLVFEKPVELPLSEEATGVVYDPLYTSPPASKPLTDEEIKRMAAPLFMSHYWNLCNEFARAIEAAHGIKGNT